jgi:integrase/recombinase XerD
MESEKQAVAAKKLNTSYMKRQAVQIPQFQVRQTKEGVAVQRMKPQGANQASDYWLQQEDVLKMISAAQSARDKAIIGLLYFGMLRRHEARSLKIEDIDWQNRILHLKITKGSKPRSVPIVEERVFEYLRMEIGKRTSGWVFLSKSKDGRLSNQAINEIVAKVAGAAGVKNPNPRRKKLNPHILRHSFARFLRRQNPPIAIEVLQKLLGHANVGTTMNIYASADMDFMKKELERCCSAVKQP